MRPQGDICLAVIEAVRAGPCTLLDIVERSQVGYDAARYTVQNALRWGHLQICGHERRPHAKCWVRIYELTEQPEDAAVEVDGGSAVLGAALSSWSRSVGINEEFV